MFLLLTHHNTKKAPVVDEEFLVNTGQIKYITMDPEGGSFIHFCDEEMPYKVLEPIETILQTANAR